MDWDKWLELDKVAPFAYKLIKQNIRFRTKKQQINALIASSKNIMYIQNPDLDLQKKAMANPWDIRTFDPHEEIQMKIVEDDCKNIEWIMNPSINVQMFVVKNDGNMIRFIHNPPKEVKIEAVKNNPNAMMYISDPEPDLVIQYLLSIEKAAFLLQDPGFDLAPPEGMPKEIAKELKLKPITRKRAIVRHISDLNSVCRRTIADKVSCWWYATTWSQVKREKTPKGVKCSFRHRNSQEYEATTVDDGEKVLTVTIQKIFPLGPTTIETKSKEKK